MDAATWDFFERNGYVVLPDALSAEDTARFRELYDRDRNEFGYLWRMYSHHQTINCDALVSTPELDEAIRHSKVLPAIEALMGGPVCFSEICIRHMARHDGTLRRGWHRDRPHLPTHPLRMDYIQLMVYLTDVDETTHCFSISPESIDDPVLSTEKQLERGGVVDIHGPAGTCALFNIATLHTATVRNTTAERKTIQVYYGHRDGKYLSNDSIIPPAFWRNHADPEVRAFYGNLNPKTHLYMAAMHG